MREKNLIKSHKSTIAFYKNKNVAYRIKKQNLESASMQFKDQCEMSQRGNIFKRGFLRVRIAIDRQDKM